MSERNLFEVLGLSPTCDGAAVKPAYFAALARCPPHRDPSGFQAIRAAYESLSDPAQLAAAYVAAPVDLAALKREYVDRLDDKIRTAMADAAAIEHFVERFSDFSWEEACRTAAQGPMVVPASSSGE